MSSSKLPVLWICGAPGAGKSVTAWSMFEKVARDVVAVAYLDIDQLGMLYPESDTDPDRFRLKTEALNALIPNYLASGDRALIVSISRSLPLVNLAFPDHYAPGAQTVATSGRSSRRASSARSWSTTGIGTDTCD